MKKILVVLAIFGFMMVGCSNGSTDEPVVPPNDGRFEGGWIQDTMIEEVYIYRIFTFTGSRFTLEWDNFLGKGTDHGSFSYDETNLVLYFTKEPTFNTLYFIWHNEDTGFLTLGIEGFGQFRKMIDE